MQNHELRRWISGARTTLLAGAALTGALALSTPTQADALVRLAGHVPAITAKSALLGHVTRTQSMPLAIMLPSRNQAELKDLIRRQSDPKDALYGKYLTPTEFADRFGATQKDYDAVVAFAKGKGLTVTGTHVNRLIVDVSGKPADIESAFGLHLNDYKMADGTKYFAPDAAPVLPASIAGKISHVFGLSSAARPQSFAKIASPRPVDLNRSHADSAKVTNSPSNPVEGVDFFAPADIQKAYNLSPVFTGKGQTVALFELGAFYSDDIATYETTFGLPNPPIDVITIDGFSGKPSSSDGYYVESELDIDSVLTTAPDIDKILVYEAPIGDGSIASISPGWLDELSRIATDDRASQVSMSYGLAEDEWEYYEGIDFITNEDIFFQEMAAQGQSVYVSSGDRGAYQDGVGLSVSSPASDPYVTAVGGTTLKTDANGNYASETTWNELQFMYEGQTYNEGAGGGGISTVWAIPSWQAPFINSANMGSTVARNVPDVALIADPLTGFLVYYGQGVGDGTPAGYYIVGGTSLASPLWGGFNADVNQARANAGVGPVGLVGPTLYAIAATPNYPVDFHDIADGSTNGNTNLFPGMPGFPAVTGYDLATGFGSYDASVLLQDLTNYSSGYAPPLDPQNVVAASGDGYVKITWSPSVGATDYQVYRSTNPQTGFSVVKTVSHLSAKDTKVTNGTTYYYFVLAVGPGGTSSGAAAFEVAATPAALAFAMPIITQGAGSGKETISWQTNDVADAMVYYATNPSQLLKNSATVSKLSIDHKITLTGLTSGKTYYYSVNDNSGEVEIQSPVSTFVAP